MAELLKPSAITPAKQQAARRFFDELDLMQISNIKPCLGPKPHTGVVFFPLPDNKVYSVVIAKRSPRNPSRVPFTDLQQYVKNKTGMPETESQRGLIHITEGFVKDPRTIYEGYGGPKATETQYWMTEYNTDRGYRSDADGKEWEQTELSRFAFGALARFNRLEIALPSEIKQEFPTYDDLLQARQALGYVDTNGIDHYDPVEVDGGKEPWNLFRRDDALAQLVAEAKKYDY